MNESLRAHIHDSFILIVHAQFFVLLLSFLVRLALNTLVVLILSIAVIFSQMSRFCYQFTKRDFIPLSISEWIGNFSIEISFSSYSHTLSLSFYYIVMLCIVHDIKKREGPLKLLFQRKSKFLLLNGSGNFLSSLKKDLLLFILNWMWLWERINTFFVY